jgi:hypothetical protein
MVVANRVMEGFFIAMLNVWKVLIPCTWILGFLHAQDMHSHPIDQFHLSIFVGVKGSQFGQLCVP